MSSADFGWAKVSLDRYEPGSLAPHLHETDGLFVLLGGDHIDDNGRSTHTQRPSSVVVHPVGLRHGTEVGPAGMVGINVFFRDEAPCPTCRAYSVHSNRLVRDSALRLAGQMIRQPCAAEAATHELLSSFSDSCSGKTPRWFRRALAFLEEDQIANVSLTGLAREIGVHPVSLCREFRRQTGTTFSDHVSGLRAARLCSAVLQSRPIGESSVASGYADHAHGTRSFRRYTGLSPAAFATACIG
ncbi:MAG: helix-turn-helix transcriptional regulator [Armatimonadetes bacterium]|nr:helix-turn-helix transcriptional regulator [Armatimonadota bacterium]